MTWHEHVSSIATAAGKKLGYLFRAGNYFLPSNAAAPTTLFILDAVQRRAIRLIGDPALTCHLQALSHRPDVDDLSLFYPYPNGFCSSELSSIIPQLSKPAKCTRGTSASHPKAVVIIRQEPRNTTAPLSPWCPWPGKDCLVMYLLSLRVLAY
nr:unnamed protein product [Callosobruchus chinensis]